jgi:hypothetical protein
VDSDDEGDDDGSAHCDTPVQSDTRPVAAVSV